MKEITSIITLQITEVVALDDDSADHVEARRATREIELAAKIKDLFDADDVIVKAQYHIMDLKDGDQDE